MTTTINGRTPEEIKKGLECCVSIAPKCDVCPYEGECLLPFGSEPESDALAYIQQLESAQPKWISVEERLPEENIDALILFKHNMAVGCYDGEGEWYVYTDDGFYAYSDGTPTHWMPLPSTEGIE